MGVKTVLLLEWESFTTKFSPGENFAEFFFSKKSREIFLIQRRERENRAYTFQDDHLNTHLHHPTTTHFYFILFILIPDDDPGRQHPTPTFIPVTTFCNHTQQSLHT
jgi:hypothetical protein